MSRNFGLGFKFGDMAVFSNDAKLKSCQSRKPHCKSYGSTLNFAKLIYRQIQLLDKMPNISPAKIYTYTVSCNCSKMNCADCISLTMPMAVYIV